MSETITREFAVAADHPAFDGHFPGQPVLPGVALLAEVLESARAEPMLAARVGSAPHLRVAKFLAAVRPGAKLEIVFRVGAKAVDWTVNEGARVAASGQFTRADLAGTEPAQGHTP